MTTRRRRPDGSRDHGHRPRAPRPGGEQRGAVHRPAGHDTRVDRREDRHPPPLPRRATTTPRRGSPARPRARRRRHGRHRPDARSASSSRCTFSADYVFPPLSAKVHRRPGLPRARRCYDLQANCSGFVTGLTVAADRLAGDPELALRARRRRRAAARASSTAPTSTPPSTFADGAGAVGARAVATPGSGCWARRSSPTPRNYESVRLRGGGSSFPAGQPALFDRRGDSMEHERPGHRGSRPSRTCRRPVRRACEKAGVEPADVDLFVFHQANLQPHRVPHAQDARRAGAHLHERASASATRARRRWPSRSSEAVARGPHQARRHRACSPPSARASTSAPACGDGRTWTARVRPTSTVGEYRIGHHARITEADIRRFVELTGDDNPLHVDRSYAEGTPFKDIVVHGMLGASLPLHGHRHQAARARARCGCRRRFDFRRPCASATTLTVTCTVTGEARPRARARPRRRASSTSTARSCSPGRARCALLEPRRRRAPSARRPGAASPS